MLGDTVCKIFWFSGSGGFIWHIFVSACFVHFFLGGRVFLLRGIDLVMVFFGTFFIWHISFFVVQWFEELGLVYFKQNFILALYGGLFSW